MTYEACNANSTVAAHATPPSRLPQATTHHNRAGVLPASLCQLVTSMTSSRRPLEAFPRLPDTRTIRQHRTGNTPHRARNTCHLPKLKSIEAGRSGQHNRDNTIAHRTRRGPLSPMHKFDRRHEALASNFNTSGSPGPNIRDMF